MNVEQWLGKDNKLGVDIWQRKYRKGNETFDQWLDRVSGGDDAVRDAIKSKRFLFGGRILSNRSITDTKVTYSNCYVITPPEDNIESIYDSRKKLARTYSYGGGAGVDLSKLAPAGAKVHNQAEQTTGAVSFMQGYSQTTEEIGQRGRRGALMISLDCHHPDLLDFIDIKAKSDSVTKANISVRVTDDFMRAVEKDDEWVMSFTREETGETITKTAKARDIFSKLCLNNWNWAEPGILFWDRIEQYNLLENNPEFEYAGTNPCAEEPLPAGGSCLLGSINLAEFVNDKCEFEWDDFYGTINVAIRALNDVLDEGLPLHPLQEQRDSVRDWRQIGLGVMGVADMLVKMHLRYDSDDAIEHCRDVSQALANHAMYVSASMAREHGKTYPKYEVGTLDTDFVRNNADSITYNAIEKYGLYNSQLLTVAPTGTLSTMLGVSGGIEPIFAKSYKRKTESLHDKTTYYDVLTPIYQQYADKHGLTVNDEFPSWFVDSSEINSIQRVKMQAAWQLGIDASISSTVNLPKSATVDDVANIYMEAWRHGLKGITIYRSGCMREGVLVVADENNVKEDAALSYCTNDDMLPRGYIVDCQNDLVGKKRKLQTGCGSLHVLAFFDPIDGNLREVYFNKGSTGGCVDADTEYFNGYEWKKIKEYNPESCERVLQYHEDGSASLTYPVAYIVNDNVGTLNHIHNSTGLDMVVSNDHRMYLYKNYTKYMMGIRSKLTSEVVTFDEFMSGSKNRHVPTTFTMSEKGIPVNDNDIRLLVAVYADGTFDGNKIVITLKKDRKKIRLRHLLSNSDIGWTERDINNTEYTVFYIHPKPSIKQWFTDKQFTSKWYDCSDSQLSTVVDECVYWDGSVGDGNRLGTYFTSKKNEADFIQFALTRLGYRATISLNNGTETKSDSYRVRWTKNNVHGLSTATIEDYKTTDGKSYCFSVPSGLLVLRRNGKIFITGNCANFMTGLSRMVSLLCRAGVDIMTIKDQLDSTGVCPSYATRRATHHDTSAGSCCPMAIGNALVDMWHEMQDGINDDEDDMVDAADCASAVPSEQQVSNNGNNAVACPECGNELVFEGGCNICKNCGWSKCG